MILSIDFDATIHDVEHPVPGRRMGPPMIGAKAALDEFKRAGHKIIIFTIWGNEEGSKTIAKWMEYYQIPYDRITNIKQQSDKYIDDKAITFKSWEEIKTLCPNLYSTVS